MISIEIGSGRNGKREQYTRYRGMYAGLQHREPGTNANQRVHRRLANSEQISSKRESKQGESGRKTDQVNLRSVKNRDNKDRDNVIYDGSCGDENLERKRDTAPEQSE